MTKIVLPDMIKRGSGQLVVMSSLSGKIGTPVASTYRYVVAEEMRQATAQH